MYTIFTVNLMGTIKTTIVLDEKVWNEFKRMVSSRHGSLRKLGSTVEEALRSFNAVDLLNSFSQSINLDISTCPSLSEVENRRQELATSAGEVIREMRDERQKRVSGL